MKCPHCKNEILEGASVCGHCRAFSMEVTAASFGQKLMTYVGLLVGIALLSWQIGLIGLMIGGGLILSAVYWVPLVIFKMYARKTIWVRPI